VTTKEGRVFLLTPNSDPYSTDTLDRTALSLERLQAALRQMSARNTVVILDACRSEYEAARGDKDNLLTEAFARGIGVMARDISTEAKAAAVLSACSQGERAYEWSAKGHGVFTYYLVEGLSQRSLGRDHDLTVADLFAYTHDALCEWTKEHVPGRLQTPDLKELPPGKIVLVPKKAAIGGELNALAIWREGLQAALQITGHDAKDDVLSFAAQIAAPAFPGEALQVTRSIESSDTRQMTSAAIVEWVASRDPQEAMRLLDAYKEDPVLSGVAQAVRPLAEAATWAKSGAVPLSPGDDGQLAEAARAVAHWDFEKGVQTAQKMQDGGRRDGVIALIIGECSGVDIERRFWMATTIAETSVREGTLWVLFRDLTLHAPELALDNFWRISNPVLRDLALAQIADALSHMGQPARALDLARVICSEDQRKMAIRGLLFDLAVVDAERAFKLALSDAPAEDRLWSLRAAVGGIAQLDPDRALEFAGRLESLSDKNATRTAIAPYLVYQDRFDEALAMVLQPVGEPSLYLYQVIHNMMALGAEDKAVAAVERIGDPELRDRALAELVGDANWQSPERALELARQVHDPERRARALLTIADLALQREGRL
jgi:hypothetical protein